eukprot:9497796-Pyramimonas_sp.AAC.2
MSDSPIQLSEHLVRTNLGICSAGSAGSPAVSHAHLNKFIGMRVRVVAACRYGPLGNLLARSYLRPKWQKRRRMPCK